APLRGALMMASKADCALAEPATAAAAAAPAPLRNTRRLVFISDPLTQGQWPAAETRRNKVNFSPTECRVATWNCDIPSATAYSSISLNCVISVTRGTTPPAKRGSPQQIEGRRLSDTGLKSMITSCSNRSPPAVKQAPG